MKAKFYSTNSYGVFTEKQIFPSVPLGGIDTLSRANAKPCTGFLGFGVAITGSSCYNLSLMTPEERREVLNDLYSKDKLNFNIGRLTVGASDYSAELYSYDDVADDITLEHFSIERDMSYIIPVIKEIIEINPDIKLFASPWSPPGWMKTGGSMGGGFMREKYLDCYADYFVKYIKAYAEQGINIYAVTPQNERDGHQFGRMPACIWHPETETEFISILRKKFDSNNIDTKIWAYDHGFYGVDDIDWCIEEHTELRKSCDGLALHYYDSNIDKTDYFREKYPELTLNFTEGGPRLYDNYGTDWCKWSLMMTQTLNHGYSSFTGWNLMLDEAGGPNVGPFFCGGLITRNYLTGELGYSGQYKAFRHIAPFVKPDSVIYPLEITDRMFTMSLYNGKRPYDAAGCIIENTDGTQTVVLVNPSEGKRQLQYCKDGAWWYIELMPNTVATVVFEK